MSFGFPIECRKAKLKESLEAAGFRPGSSGEWPSQAHAQLHPQKTHSCLNA